MKRLVGSNFCIGMVLAMVFGACGTSKETETPPSAAAKAQGASESKDKSASPDIVPAVADVQPQKPADATPKTDTQPAKLADAGKPAAPQAKPNEPAPGTPAEPASKPIEVPAQGAPAKEFTKADLAGDWLGVLDASRMKLRIALHVRTQPDGTLKATLDSLDQGANGMPVDSITLEKGEFRIESKLVHSAFSGNVVGRDTLEGFWEQGGAKLPFKMTRTAEIPALSRPQDPKGPLPYKEEEVVIAGKTADVSLAGTLTLPKVEGKAPAVLLITGSGLQDRNETLLGHRPFLVLADHLTRAGIVVLRVDDRGFGASKGDASEATTADFADDAEAEFRFLRQRPEVDPAKVGVLGHSEGAIIAGMLAARLPEVAFMVLLAGPGVNGEQIVVKQVELNAKAEGLPEAEVKRLVGVQKEVFFRMRESPDAGLRKDLHDLMMDQAVPAAVKEAKTPEAKEALRVVEQQLEAQISGLMSPWFRFFMRYDPASDLRKVKCPVLALVGEKDTQVDADMNLKAIQEALAESGNTQVTAKKLPGLNHLFQTAKTGGVGEYATIEETFQPDALNVVSAWILSKVSPGP